MGLFSAQAEIAVVNAGQRQTNDKAILVVNSTKGGFTLSGTATSILEVAHGDYVQFLTNYDKLVAHIKQGAQYLKDFCTEHGLTFGTEEANVAILKNADFYIAKGHKMLDKVGNPVMVNERLTMEDKKAYAETNFDDMLQAAIDSNKEELVNAITREGITKEEQIDILAQNVVIETEKYAGSKCASSSKASGTGVPVKFTDSNVWNQFKRDMPEDVRDTMNRTYSLDIANPYVTKVNNGFEDIEITAYPLIFVEDSAPMTRGSKNENND